MQVSRLEAEGIFSFGAGEDRFALDFGKGLSVIVGPNASGKSNVSRLLNLLQSAVRFEDANQEDRNTLYAILDDHVRSARHDGMPASARSLVRLDIRLNSQAEVRLLTAYLQALVLSSLLGSRSADDPSLPVFEAWIAEHVTSDSISHLFEGTIAIFHSGIPGTLWNVAYEFDCDGAPLAWHIQTSIPNLRNAIAPRERTATTRLPIVQTLNERLMGVVQATGDFEPPETPFSFNALLPTKENLARVEMEAISANVPPAPHRAFVTAAGMAVPAGDPLGPFRRSYSLAAVLSRILDWGLWYLGGAGATRELTSSGMGLPGHADRQLTSPTPQGDISMLSARLVELKNGDQAAQARYRDIQGLFTELAPGHRFELHSWQRQKIDGPAEQEIEIEVFPTSGSTAESAPIPHPLRFAGTGVEQALVIAETLVGAPERIVILDEPATNLHPAWQSVVRSHLCSRSGQCLLVTHSPYLIPSENGEQLATIVRFDVRQGATRTFRLSPEDLSDERWVGTMVKELSWSADARGLLFAGGVILLEGETELAALPTWFSKSPTAARHRGPDDLHILFYSVGGDQSFQSFVSYLDRFGIPWAVVCDGAAFRFDRRKHIFEQVVDAGVDDPKLAEYIRENIAGKSQNVIDGPLFTSMIEIGKDHGIFSLARGWRTKKEVQDGGDESFEAYLASQPDLSAALESAKAAPPASKPRTGRLVGELTDCPSEVDQLYSRVLRHLWSQGMAKYPEL